MRLTKLHLVILLAALVLTIIVKSVLVARNTALLPAPTSTTVSLPVVVTPPARAIEMYNALEQVRVSAGLPPLALNARLMVSAQNYALALSKVKSLTLSHVGADGSLYYERNAAAGYPWTGWEGEIIAAGEVSAVGVVRQWMGSPLHKAVIVNPVYHVVGLAWADVSGSVYSNYEVIEFGEKVIP